MVDPNKTILPGSWFQMADLLFCGSFAVSLGIFGFQFAYRYQVLRGNATWTSKRLLNFVFWLGSPLLFATIWTIALAIFMPLNDYDRVVLERESVLPPGVDPDSIGFVGAFFYPKLGNGTKVVNWDSMIGVSVTTTILMSSEITMFLFATKCFLATKRLMAQAGHSKSFRRLQWQLFYALVIQTLIPITFIQGPFSIIYVTTLILDNSSEVFGHFLALTIPMYLATDALPTIFIIKQYRDTVLGAV
uniref:G protein-coupled receptor n=1 Tax=Caenorhabditis tropicalis TaxID=1561998 RepID=A0A1I7TUF5_9PELO